MSHLHAHSPTESTSTSPRRGTCRHVAEVASKDASFWASMDVLPSLSAATKCGSPWTPPSGTHVNDGFLAITSPPTCSYPGCGYYRRIAICIHCGKCLCLKHSHIHQHLHSSSLHTFAWDVDAGAVYCGRCSDYVYDEQFAPRLHQDLDEHESKLVSIFATPTSPCGGKYRLRGLKNLGATCYMNVILQVLIHNPYLRTFFLSDLHPPQACGAPSCVACEFDSLYSKFFSGESLPHVPHAMLHSLWTLKRDIASYGQHDAHELFMALINAIHSGLTHGTPGSPPPTQRGTMLANGNLAAAPIPQQCPCAIHSTFGGVLHSKLTCTNCQNVTFLSEAFLDLSLDLKATEQQAASNTWAPRASAVANAYGAVTGMLGAAPKVDRVSLAQCLEKYVTPETVACQCNQCGNGQHRKQMTVQVLPKSLCFQFKRFESSTNGGSNKVEIPVTIPMTISMAQYMTRSDASQKKPNPLQYTYSLYAVVHHTGKLDTGHYTVCIQDRGHWFRMDDDKVTQVTEAMATGATAYMCFYHGVMPDGKPM